MTLAHHILVPTDFSSATAPALDAAASLARDQGARVTVMHVFDPSSLALGHVGLIPSARTTPTEAEIESAIRDALDEILERHFAAGVEVEAKLLHGAQPADAIVEEAERSGIDLIVMGTEGRSTLGKHVIGSVTERVVRHAGCMTLVVPSAPA